MDATQTVVVPMPVTLEVVAPDFEIERCIGEGSFGQVFLGRSKATGRYRAIKVVRRSRFNNEHPYEMEFAGLRRFEEVSREHEGFVDILHVSRDDQGGYFCYVMELAEDVALGQQIDPARYVPRTLSKELERRKRLAPAECVRIGLALAAALGELHRRNLVHRDVNPRNIVFVRGAPKLADVGLVAEADVEHHTLVGTPEYMDPEVHGTPGGDLYSLGKILYTMATGRRAWEWPQASETGPQDPDLAILCELEAIWRKACNPDRRRRYQEADDIYRELQALQAGAALVQLKRVARFLSFCRRYAMLLLLMLISAGVGVYMMARQQSQAAELRQRKVGAFVAHGNHLLEIGDLLGALTWFGEAWRLDTAENQAIHRIRLESVLKRAPCLIQMWFQDRQIKEAFFAGQENQVVVSDRGKWQVFDMTSGLSLHRPFGKGLPRETVSFSSVKGTAVTAASQDRVWLWDYKTGQSKAEFCRPGHTLTKAVISPDGEWIAAAQSNTNHDETLLLWSVARPDQDPFVLGQHPLGTHCLTFDPLSRLLLSTGGDWRARVWDITSRQLACVFTNHHERVFGGAFSPDSTLVVTASFDRSARIWEARTGLERARFEHDDAVFAAGFSADGARLVTAGLDFSVRVWDTATGACSQVLRHNSKVLRAEFSPQDRFILTSCFDDTVRVWSLREQKFAAKPLDGVLTWFGRRQVFCTNGTWILGNVPGGIMFRLGLTNAAEVEFPITGDRHCLAATWTVGASAADQRQVRAWDAETGVPWPRVLAAPAGCTNLAAGRGGELLCVFSRTNGAVLDSTSGRRLATLPQGAVCAAFSPDGSLLAVAQSNRVDVLDARNAFTTVSRWLHPTNSEVTSVRWDPSGRRLVSGSWNNTFTPLHAQVWLAQTGKPAGPPLAHRDGVLYATFSHDGKRVITCGEDFAASLWNPTSGLRLAPALQHRHQVLYAVFSADDRLVATISREGTVAVWATESGEPLTSFVLPLDDQPEAFEADFTKGNRELLVRRQSGRSFRCELPYYDRPLEDLRLMAQLLSAEHTDSTGTLVPYRKDALRKIWQTLTRKYPRDFSISGE